MNTHYNHQQEHFSSRKRIQAPQVWPGDHSGGDSNNINLCSFPSWNTSKPTTNLPTPDGVINRRQWLLIPSRLDPAMGWSWQRHVQSHSFLVDFVILFHFGIFQHLPTPHTNTQTNQKLWQTCAVSFTTWWSFVLVHWFIPPTPLVGLCPPPFPPPQVRMNSNVRVVETVGKGLPIVGVVTRTVINRVVCVSALSRVLGET